MKSFRTMCTMIVLTLATFAASAQDLTFSDASAPPTINYSPFTASSGTGTLTVRNNNKYSSFNYYFSCATSLSSRSVSAYGYSIPFFVYKSGVTPLAQVLPWSWNLSYNNALWGTVAKKGTASRDYDIVPESGHWVPAGNYVGSLTFELDKGVPGQNNLQGSASPTISVQVLPITDISLVTSGTTFDVNAVSSTLDFGELVTGTERSLNVLVRANKSWSLSVLAPSKGYMTSATGSTPVPYSFYFAGALKDLSSGSAVLVPTTSWTASGQNSYPIKFMIGAFDSLDPGLYNDNLSILITAN